MSYPKPTEKEPDIETIGRMITGFADSEATDGCTIEPDGVCHHGYPSWLLQLGYM